MNNEREKMWQIPSRTKEKYQMTYSREIPTPIFKTGISRIRNRSTKHYEATFDVSTYQKCKICINESLTKPLSVGGEYPNSNLSKFLSYTEVYFHYFSLLSFNIYNIKS